MMNETIHQGDYRWRRLGGTRFASIQAFRTALKALQEFKEGLKREPLPAWFPLLHIVAGALVCVGFRQLMQMV